MVETRRKITEDEFKALPDQDRKVELVDGEVVEVPTFMEHGLYAVTLILLLAPIARKLGYILESSTGFRMANGNIRSPDVSFIRRERLPNGIPRDFGDGAPDLCVEIISPSERPGAIYQKMADYFDSGAQQVWLLRPERQTVTVYGVEPDPLVLGPDNELDGGDLLPGFHCRVADIFVTE